MASITLGRTECPIKCGHTAAQVKLKTDKAEGKAAQPYIHCAGCGIQVHARNGEQADHIRALMRPEKELDTQKPQETPQEAPKAVPAMNPRPALEKPPVAPPGKPAGLFTALWG